MNRLKTGIAYFVRNRDHKRVEQDLLDIKNRGCTYVVHFMTEFDTVFFPESVKEICQVTRDLGLEVHLDPWGLGVSSALSTLLSLDRPEECQMLSDGSPLMQACPTVKCLSSILDGGSTKPRSQSTVHIRDEPHLFFDNNTKAQLPDGPAGAQDVRSSSAMYGHTMPVEPHLTYTNFAKKPSTGFLTESRPWPMSEA